MSAATDTAICPAPRYGVQHSAPGVGKTVALTFDDGPGASTGAILSILQRYGIPATFFNVGANEYVRPQEMRAEATLGYILGNHTWDHPHMTTLSATDQGSEMDRASAAQVNLVGLPTCVFRPPFGEYNTTTLNAAYNRRMSVWTWSVDTEDWKAAGSGSQYWIDQIVSRAIAGGSQTHPVVLMHNQPNGNPATVSALPTIIEYYRSHGYTFVDLLGHAGNTLAAPALAATSGGLHVFYRGSDGAVYERTRGSGGWSGAATLGGSFYDGPAAVALDTTTTALFAQGAGNHLYTQTVTDSGSRSGWSDLGGILTSRPGATVSANGVVRVVARGTDGAAWMRERTGGVWGAWFSLGGVVISGFAAAATNGSEATVAALGTDHALWVRHRSTTWSPWTPAGGYINADPAVSATAGGAATVAVVRGGDNGTWVDVGNATATSWSGWSTIGGILMSGPAVAVDGSALAVFAYGTDGRIWQNIAANGAAVAGWSGWQVLPG